MNADTLLPPPAVIHLPEQAPKAGKIDKVAIDALRTLLEDGMSPVGFAAAMTAFRPIFQQVKDVKHLQMISLFLEELLSTGFRPQAFGTITGNYSREYAPSLLAAQICHLMRSTDQHFSGGTDWYTPLFIGLNLPAHKEGHFGRDGKDPWRDQLQNVLPIELWRDVNQPESESSTVSALYCQSLRHDLESSDPILKHMERFNKHEDHYDINKMWNNCSVPYLALLKILEDVLDTLFYFTMPLIVNLSEVYIPVSIFVPVEKPKQQRKSLETEPKNPGHLLLRIYKTGKKKEDTAMQVIPDWQNHIIPSTAVVLMKNITWWSTKK